MSKNVLDVDMGSKDAPKQLKQFAEQIGMHRANLVDILHCKTKAPTLLTISKILDGLGYTLSLDLKVS